MNILGNPHYLASLPERTVRAVAAGVGGLIYEVTAVLLPGWLRRSRLYQAIVARLLRIMVELIGGVTGVLPPEDVNVTELAVRKTAGNVVELASFLAVGWSPLWLLAAAADLTGGTRAYLRAFVSELKRNGVLPKDTDIASAEELLNTLEETSSLMAETVDLPPLNVRDMRRSWQALQQNVAKLPDASRLARIYAQLQQVAIEEDSSLRSVSSLIAAGAIRAGVEIGHTYIFDYYHDALCTITTEGLPAYAQRVTKPYLAVAVSHFDANRMTHTERLLERLRQRAGRRDEKQIAPERQGARGNVTGGAGLRPTAKAADKPPDLNSAHPGVLSRLGEEARRQRCPMCSTEVPINPRYPRYVCGQCAAKASSIDGRLLEFFNEGLSGGFVARYADTHEPYPGHECFIDGIKCWADEARFGGIVIQVQS